MGEPVQTLHGNESRFGMRGAASDLFSHEIYVPILRVLSGIAILVLSLWTLLGIVHLALGLVRGINADWSGVAEQMILNALVILALMEVIRTFQAYLTLGRVRVTFIIDTALVVLIGELMGLWFKDYIAEKLVLGMAVIVALVALRIVTQKFSPEHH